MPNEYAFLSLCYARVEFIPYYILYYYTILIKNVLYLTLNKFKNKVYSHAFPILKPKRTASTLLNILEPDQFHIFDSTNVVPTYKDIYTRG